MPPSLISDRGVDACMPHFDLGLGEQRLEIDRFVAFHAKSGFGGPNDLARYANAAMPYFHPAAYRRRTIHLNQRAVFGNIGERDWLPLLPIAHLRANGRPLPFVAFAAFEHDAI